MYLFVRPIDRPNIKVYKIKGKRSGEKERLGASLIEWAHGRSRERLGIR